MELVPEDVSLLERCPHFRGGYMYRFQWSYIGHEDVSLLQCSCGHGRLCINSCGFVNDLQ